MRIMLVTVPLRGEPDRNPPIAPLSLMKYLRKNGVKAEVNFYHIDALRPAYEDVVAAIRDWKPDIFGVSAVVSTAYAYTKNLARDVKAMFPDTLVVVGGNLAASAEVLLRRTKTDICVLGEGEIPFLEIARRAERTRLPEDFKDIPGVAVLDRDRNLHNSGYAPALPPNETWDFDIEDVKDKNIIGNFIYPAFDTEGRAVTAWVREHPRSHEPHRRGKYIASLVVTKGCVARCTFCHRWDKGIRHIPIDRVMRDLDRLVKNHNVGFVQVYAETFGNDKKWLEELCRRIEPYDLVLKAGGVRVNAFDQKWLARLRDVGFVTLNFGTETGSAEMLEVMEKKVTIEDNYNAIKWTVEAGIRTGVALVLGMPGETPKTINDTIKYCQTVLTYSKDQDVGWMSTNYAQALPGTPLYEYARSKGLIAPGIDGEEAYLLEISNQNAYDALESINFTDSPLLTCMTWRPLIGIETKFHYQRTFGREHYLGRIAKSLERDEDFVAGAPIASSRPASPSVKTKNGVPVPPPLLSLVWSGKFGEAILWYPHVFHYLRWTLPMQMLFVSARRNGLGYAWSLLRDYVEHALKRLARKGRDFTYAYQSLRRIVERDIKPYADGDPMTILRKGR